MKTKKILFVGLRAFGDMVLTQPAISAIRDSCPEARIDYVMEAPYVPLFREEPDLFRVIPLPRKKRNGEDPESKTTSYMAFLRSIRETGYDVAVDFFSRGPRSRTIVLASGATRRVGTADHGHPLIDRFVYTDQIVVPNQLTHLSDQILHIMSRLGFKTERNTPRFVVTLENQTSALALLGPFGNEYFKDFLILFPGSGALTKNWPSARYAQLALDLIDIGYPVLVLGGVSDTREVEDVVSTVQRRGGRYQKKFAWILQNDLPTLKGIISLSRAAIGNDSGPLHLVQALGKKALVFFGPGDHISYRPFLGGLVRKGLSCSPCQSFAAQCPDNQCMKMIDLPMVLSALSDLGFDIR